MATQGWLDLVCPLQPFSNLALCVARSPPAPTLRRPIWWSILPSRPAGEREKLRKRYYAVLEWTARSPGASSALAHHLEPPQTPTADLTIIGLMVRWHASNAHLPQSTPLLTAAQSRSYRKQIRYAAMQGIYHRCAVDCNSSRLNPPSATLCTTRSILLVSGCEVLYRSRRGVATVKQSWLLIYTAAFAIVSHPQARFRCICPSVWKPEIAVLPTSQSQGDAICFLHGTMHIITSAYVWTET